MLAWAFFLPAPTRQLHPHPQERLPHWPRWGILGFTDFISYTVSPLATFLSLGLLVITKQGWSSQVSSLRGPYLSDQNFPWEAADSGQAQIEVSVGPKGKGAVPCRLFS